MLTTLPIFLSAILIFGPAPTVAINQTQNIPQGMNTTVPSMQSGTGMTEDVSCTMPNGVDGECVPYYLCKNAQLQDVATQMNGFGVIDVNGGPMYNCASYYDVCCQPSDIIPPDQHLKYPKRQQVGCGWANPDGVGLKIVGSNDDTKFGEFPWMVAILIVEPNDDEPSGKRQQVYVGGGSLIHTSVVLTFAHKVAKEKTLKVRAGEWDTQTTKEIYSFQDRDVASIEIHKDFDKRSLVYDIAILFLDTPMVLTPHVGVVCLPPARILQRKNTRCIATGWGTDKFGKEGRYQVILKKIELPVVTHGDCQAALRKTRLGANFKLHHTFMCAGGELGKDTCKGDGGAPLSCPIPDEKDRYVQSGIVAWGIGCGEDGTPGVYVDVSVVRDWIDDKVVSKGYDPKIYSY